MGRSAFIAAYGLFVLAIISHSPRGTSAAPVSKSNPGADTTGHNPVASGIDDVAADIAAELHRLRELRLKQAATHRQLQPQPTNNKSTPIETNVNTHPDEMDKTNGKSSASGAGAIATPTKASGTGSTAVAVQRITNDKVSEGNKAVSIAQIGEDGHARAEQVISTKVQAQSGDGKPKEIAVTQASSKETLPDGQSKTVVKTEYQAPGERPRVETKTFLSQEPRLQGEIQQIDKKQGSPEDPSKISGTGPTNEEISATSGSSKGDDFLSPTALAEYIIATGDEESVAMAVEDLLKEGLLSRDDAIRYLREVKGDLDTMRAEAAVQEVLAEEQQQLQSSTGGPNSWSLDQEQLTNEEKQAVVQLENEILAAEQDIARQQEQRQRLKLMPSPLAPEPRMVSTASSPAQLFPESALIPMSSSGSAVGSSATAEFGMPPILPDGVSSAAAVPSVSRYPSSSGAALADAEYNEMLSRLKFVDLLYTEYGLEDILYKLAKLMFDESLSKSGVGSADSILTKLNDYLNGEEKAGRLTTDLQKRIQDVLVASLFDSLQEDAFGSNKNAGPATNEATKQNISNRQGMVHATGHGDRSSKP